MYFAIAILVFAAAYFLNIATITLLFHRDLAHGAIRLHPRLRSRWIKLAPWITGLDPKAWVVMHRRHHAFSDTPMDPHSPKNSGIAGIFREQLRSYKRVIVGLIRQKRPYTDYTEGLDFPLGPLNRNGLWFLPYALHLTVAAALLLATGSWILGVAYFAGMMSHPVQGALVNAFGHASGGRNFDTDDDSRNNIFVALVVAGEGYQNNHHAYPASAKFSYTPWEFDWGFTLCQILERLGLCTIRHELLIPPPPIAHTEAQAK